MRQEFGQLALTGLTRLQARRWEKKEGCGLTRKVKGTQKPVFGVITGDYNGVGLGEGKKQKRSRPEGVGESTWE